MKYVSRFSGPRLNQAHRESFVKRIKMYSQLVFTPYRFHKYIFIFLNIFILHFMPTSGV